MLKWFDGFERYGNIARMTEGIGGGAAWSEVTAGWSLATSNPATGSYQMRMASSTSLKQMRRVWGEAKQIVGGGYRFMVTDLPSREGLLYRDGALVLAQIRDVSNNDHLTLILGTDGSIVARRDFTMNPSSASLASTANGTEIGRSNPCVARGGYHHFEFKTKIDDTTGYIEVRVNEVTVLNLTGIDTQGTANAAAAQFSIGESKVLNSASPPDASAGFGNFDIDDVFAWDTDATDSENTIADWVGDKGVYLLKPNGDTAEADFTVVNSVTSYGAINEVPPSGTSYLQTADATARTVVEVEPLPDNVAEVIALSGFIYARKEESGTVGYRAGLISGTDETYGPEDNPSTAYAYLRPGPKTIDPATGVPWASDADPKLLIERTA